MLEYDAGIVAEAIRKELARGGQVYYLHNRVESIDQCAAKIKQRIPEAEIAVAHGKMNEEQLGDVMQSMSNGEIQILVCTTIIETGIDIPNVNTLIIEDADRMGLAQLYQIRGRVGRSGRKAYAYFTFRRDKTLTDIAQRVNEVTLRRDNDILPRQKFFQLRHKTCLSIQNRSLKLRTYVLYHTIHLSRQQEVAGKNVKFRLCAMFCPAGTYSIWNIFRHTAPVENLCRSPLCR